MDLPEISTYEPKPVPPGTLDSNAAASQAKASTGTQLSFVQPGADETVFDNQGNVAVALRVEPPLQPHQRLALQLDDAAVVETSQPTYQFSGLDRGTHTLHAWVVGANGQSGSPKAAVTFHLRQASKLFRNPAPAERPDSAGAESTHGPQRAQIGQLIAPHRPGASPATAAPSGITAPRPAEHAL